MDYTLKYIRLDKLNIPIETLRKSSFPANDENLKNSIECHGVIVPIIVTKLGKKEYSVWDGTRRTKTLKAMGKPGSFLVPALITKGSDVDSVIAQMNINQNRERLNSFAEVEGLRQLVKDHNLNISKACKQLLKSPSWGSKVMSTFNLPKPILDNFHAGKLILSQVIILAQFIEDTKILNLLHKEALKGTSADILKALAFKLKKGSSNLYKPQLQKVGKKSWIRIKPLQKGVSCSIHFNEDDKSKDVLKELKDILAKIK